MSTEKFCLKWNDFESNISVAFRDLRADSQLFDVTLACCDNSGEGQKYIQACISIIFCISPILNPLGGGGLTLPPPLCMKASYMTCEEIVFTRQFVDMLNPLIG